MTNPEQPGAKRPAINRQAWDALDAHYKQVRNYTCDSSSQTIRSAARWKMGLCVRERYSGRLLGNRRRRTYEQHSYQAARRPDERACFV